MEPVILDEKVLFRFFLVALCASISLLADLSSMAHVVGSLESSVLFTNLRSIKKCDCNT